MSHRRLPRVAETRLIVSGTRDLPPADAATVQGALQAELDKHGELVVVEGGASGVDTTARDWAREKGVRVETWHAEWGKYGGAAGPKRNQKMVDAGADLVLAFPGPSSRGTWDLVRRAKVAAIETVVTPVGDWGKAH